MNDDIVQNPAPAESEISIEKIDTSTPENSGSVSVEGEQLVIHSEEETIQLNDNQPVEQNNDPGYITTRIPDYVAPEYVPEQTGMKYAENDFLQEALNHIIGTYGEHYANPEKQGIQVFDLWDSLDSLDTTARDTAIKYLARYGKKDGYNKKDLFKAIHYICMLNYATAGKR